MICPICGKEGATEPYNDGRRVHDWCRDSITIIRHSILIFFNEHGYIVMGDAIEKMVLLVKQYPQLIRSKTALEKVLNDAISRCLKRGDSIIAPEDISIEVELSFSYL
jgi:hypothetical protein